MFDSGVALIVYREILEIAMILGVVLAATKGLPGRLKWIGLGFGGGIGGAMCVALLAGRISAMAEGMGQEFFNAMILFAAAIVIGWTALWMRTHAREMAAHMKQIGQEVTSGKLPGFTLTMVIGLALLREGSEIVLFLYGQWVQHPSMMPMVLGAGVGLTLGTITGLTLYIGLIKLSSRYMLKVTGWLLVLLVAGLNAQAVDFLSQAGYFSGWTRPLWNTSWLLSDGSMMGKALHTLIGYSARPTAISASVYIATLMLLFSIMQWMERRHDMRLTPQKAA